MSHIGVSLTHDSRTNRNTYFHDYPKYQRLCIYATPGARIMCCTHSNEIQTYNVPSRLMLVLRAQELVQKIVLWCVTIFVMCVISHQQRNA